MSKADPARRIALEILLKVIQHGESLSSAIPDATHSLSSQDKAFVQMLVYGVLRWYWRLQSLLKQLIKKPLKAKDQDVELVLLMALYQLMETRVPDHASVNASVALVKKKKSWAAGLVNAVLRNFIRQQDALLCSFSGNLEAEYAHPQWIIDRLKNDWPGHWKAILQANNEQAPMTLRVNQQVISAEDYLSKLDAPAKRIDQAVELDQPADVVSLPGYLDGWFSVQDAGAQKAAPLLNLTPGMRVLDACAAPGGKTCHMLEIEPEINLLALDISDRRIQRIEENLQRLKLSAQLITADAAQPDAWWDGEVFDRILLDVPCSASGVIRRHPDIKLLRRAEDIEKLAVIQRDMLNKVWPLLADDGFLLYATCSVFQQENEQQIDWFLKATQDAQHIEIDADWGEPRPYGRQIFPGQNGMDGFYYALLQKRPG